MAVINGTALRDILVGTALSDQINGLAGNDDLYGLAGNDTLNGGAGRDRLFGGNGNDILIGGAGNDVMRGGQGNDVYAVQEAGDRVIEAFNQGTDTIVSYINYTLSTPTLTFIENLTLGGSATTGIGNFLDNVITGNALANTLLGEFGNDTVNGGAGDDFMFGGFGNDILNGGTGADSMTGGFGNDTYHVDNVGDRVSELFGQGTDEIVSSISTRLTLPGRAAVENLTLVGNAVSGIGNDLGNTINGNAGNNALLGGAGGDILNGNAGDDALFGGTGSDDLHGGLGADDISTGTGFDEVFFDTALGGTNIDDVQDFNPIFDQFILENTGVGLFNALANGVLAANQFFNGIQAVDLNTRIIYNGVTGNLYYDADGSLGNVAQVQFAHLEPGLALTANDFFVI